MSGRSKEKLHAGHRQRLKEQCLENGFDGLPSHQVLELLLFYAMPYKDTNELAHRLLDRFGSFAGVVNADYQELLQVNGVGPNTACLLALLPEFFRRYQLDMFGKRPRIADRQQLAEYAQALLAGKHYEAMYIVCMDAQRRVTGAPVLGEGTLSEVVVYPRNTVEMALRYQAKYVVLAHNHPGGTLRPSSADVQLTDQLRAVLRAVGITVLDHVIVAGDGYYSFADHGLIRGVTLPARRI